MSSMPSAYLIIGGFALVALFIHMEWLLYLLLLAFAALLVGDSLSQTRSHEPHGHGGHHSETTKSVHAPPASFFDVLLANLIAGEHRAHGEHKKHEKTEESILEEVKEEHEHEDKATKEHLEAQLGKIEGKISENIKAGNEKVVKELKKQKGLLKEKLAEITGGGH